MNNKYLLQLVLVIDTIKSMIRNSKGQFTKDSVVRKYDFTGRVFTYLTVISPTTVYKKKTSGWLCRCKCGKMVKVPTDTLNNGKTKSCGCYSHELAGNRTRTHGKSLTKLHSIWKGIRERCYTKTCNSYKNYGGRGIIMSEDWQNYINFERDMEKTYLPGLTIERINFNGNYCKENCKWVSRLEQGNNKRNNHKITFNGVTKNLSQWAREYKIKPHTLLSRINRGWGVYLAMTTKTSLSNRLSKLQISGVN